MAIRTRHASLFAMAAILASGALNCSPAAAQCPTDFWHYTEALPQELAPGNGVVFGAFDIPALINFDPDGAGPQAPYLIAAIHYLGPADCANQFTISSEWCRLDRFDSATNTWIPMTQRFDGIVNCMTTFDEDGAGPLPPRLYIGGRFDGMGPEAWAIVPSRNIIKFDGDFFDFVNDGINGEVHTMLVHDDDGPGPVLPKLYVGGDFTSTRPVPWQPQVDANRLIRFTRAFRWENPGCDFNDRVFALSSFDEDGPGPGLPQLVAGGAFRSNNGDNSQRMVARYNGSTWAPFAQGFDPMNADFFSGRRVFALREFDEDGAGPQLPSLFVGGTIYKTTEGQASPLVIRWQKNASTGVAGWLSIPSPPLLYAQPDGDACSTNCANTPTRPDRPRVLSMMPFDIDGTGQSAMYIGGDLRTTGGYFQGIMKWNPADNTTQWVNRADGSSFGVQPYTMLVVPATGSVPARLLMGTGYTGTEAPVRCLSCPPGQGCPFSPVNIPTTYGRHPVAALGRAGAGPSVINQPDNVWVTRADANSAGFAVVTNGTAPITYQWRKDGIDLVNGASQGFGATIGATGPAVILGGNASPVNLTSQGWYDCRINNECGNRQTTRAWLVVQPVPGPSFPIRFDAPVPPVSSTIGNAPMSTIFADTVSSLPFFYSEVTGTPFAIAPTGSNTWRGRNHPNAPGGGPDSIRTIFIPTNNPGIGEVYTLINTDGSAATDVRILFTATGGLTHMATLSGGTHIRSYSTAFGPQTAASADTTNVFTGVITRMDKQRITLPAAFRNQTLTSISISDHGSDAVGRAILAGLTLMQLPPVPACGPADLGSAGGVQGADGLLDNNDFIAFINLFFAGDPSADLGSAGGFPGADGLFDNNDFIAFIDFFFAGCP